ncbi:hypothetical protein VTK56DRAFT_7877 [Thermocarpiscus australiensis]
MSADGMALLLEGDPMNVDASIQGIQGMQDMQDMQGIRGMALDEVDLFGDPVMNNALAGLPPRPLQNKQLQQRLDELRSRGCCQGIAWSRQGTIAAITNNGMSIDLRFTRCNPDDGDWQLTESTPWSTISLAPSPGQGPSPLSTPSLASAGAPVVHLSWAPTSTPELAVIDALGRITLLTFSISLNRPYATRRWDSDPADDLHAVVGCYWLPLGMMPGKQAHIVHGPAIWSQSEYRYKQTIYPAFGPWHPNPSKSALLCVTTNGLLKLLFSQNNNRMDETALELESVVSSDDLITHASMCTDKNTLLVALATASKQLRVERVSIQWGLPQVDKQVPPGSMPMRPSLRESHVAATSWFQLVPSESLLDSCMAQLSHVEMLPPLFEGPSQVVAPPVVLTVRSYMPSDSSTYHQECQSIIDRWEVLSDQPQSLHPAFGQLGSKNGAGPPLPTMNRLRKLDPLILPKIVVTVNTIQLGRVLCFAFSDGTVQYRDRFTMNEIYNQHNTNSIMSPLEVGFQFVDSSPCLQVAFSPTNCSFVQICEDETVKWNRLHYPTSDPTTALQGTQQNAVLAALSIAMSTVGASIATSPAGGQLTSCDDILAVARPFVQKPDFAYAWIKELVNMFKIMVDYSEDTHHDQLVRNQLLQLCLSILNHMGFHGDFRPRSFCGKFALLALNTRNVVILITLASNTPLNLKEKMSPLDESEVVEALAGCAKWAVDLLSWLTDCLFQLVDDPEIMAMLLDAKRFPELASYLQSRNDVSLHLLLCSSTRGFLSAACRRLMHLETLSHRATQYYETRAQQQRDNDPSAASRPPPALYHAYLKMQRAVSSSLVKVQEFDALLGGLSKDIQQAYQKSLSGLVAKVKPQPGSSEQQQKERNDHFIKKAQAHCELDMLLGANPPPSFREVLSKFFTSSLPAFRAQTDPAKLYFANFDLLEVEDDARSLALKRAAGRYVDIFKRVQLTVGPPPPRPGATTRHAIDKAKDEEGGSTGSGNGNGNGSVGDGSGGGQQWRRCVRCAAVMEDVIPQRPGFTFVLAQQRKCSCGGNWGLMPKGA